MKLLSFSVYYREKGSRGSNSNFVLRKRLCTCKFLNSLVEGTNPGVKREKNCRIFIYYRLTTHAHNSNISNSGDKYLNKPIEIKVASTTLTKISHQRTICKLSSVYM